MAEHPSLVAKGVASRALWLNRYALRMQRKGLSAADLNQVYSGAFSSYFAFVEQRIEELFLGLLVGRFDYGRPDVVPMAQFHAAADVNSIVFGGRDYADWLPYTYTVDRAKLFFKDGGPFVALAPQHKGSLTQLSVMRNAVVHDSRHARRKFKTVFTEGRALRPGELSPAGYLRGQHAAGTTRLEFLFGEGVAAMQALCQ